MLISKKAFCALLALVVVQATGCGPTPDPVTPPPGPVAPDAATVQAAAGITKDLPGANVSFSSNTGQIALVTSPGLANVQPGITPAPLTESRGTDENARASGMLEFFSRYKGAFNLTDAAGELRIARDPINDQQFTQAGALAPALGAASGMQIQHLHRTFNGVHVYGQFATGVFDGQGNLQSLITRLLPIPSSVVFRPTLDAAGAFALVNSAQARRQVTTYTLDGKLQDVDAADDSSVATPDHAEELILLPIERSSGRMGVVHADVDYRLTYEVRMRSGADRTHAWVDAVTGEIMNFRSDTPSGWWDAGNDQLAGANDELNNFQLFLTDLFSNNWYMAITGNGFSSNWLGSGNFVSMDNLYAATNRNKFTATPISIPSTLNGAANYWNNDPTFNANTTAGAQLRQSSHFLKNIAAAEDWYAARNWVGWDGQSGTFYAAIGMKKSAAAGEDLNAWGGNGTLGLGGAITKTNQYLGSSQMVIGHEFTHSVISATSALEYHDESGATNEAMADIIGMAMVSKGDTFSSTIVGGDVGFPIRDMKDPTIYSQPDRYSNYVVTTTDSNGVHTNSGIFNKAHGLLVLGGTFNGVTVARIGMGETEKILRLAMIYKTYPTTASMQEFANGVLGMCAITDAINQVFGDTHYGVICKQFRKAYQAVEVLPREKIIAVSNKYIQQLDQILQAGVTNKSYAPADLSKLKVTLIDANGAENVAEIAQVLGDDGQTATVLNPGDTGRVMVKLPTPLANSLSKNTSALKVRIELAGDGVSADQNYLKEISTVVGSDYAGVKPVYTFTQNQGVNLGVSIENRKGTSYPANLSAALLYRATSNGAFTTLGEASLGTDVSTSSPVTLKLADGVVFNATLTPVFLQSGSEIPGMPGRYQVWFNAQGGLPELNDHSQYYALIDPRDVNTELDKTNNLVCLNCRVPGQAQGDTNGVIVRFPYNAPVMSMFPTTFLAAAAQLPADFRVPFAVQEILAPRLNFKTIINAQ